VRLSHDGGLGWREVMPAMRRGGGAGGQVAGEHHHQCFHMECPLAGSPLFQCL